MRQADKKWPFSLRSGSWNHHFTRPKSKPKRLRFDANHRYFLDLICLGYIRMRKRRRILDGVNRIHRLIEGLKALRVLWVKGIAPQLKPPIPNVIPSIELESDLGERPDVVETESLVQPYATFIR